MKAQHRNLLFALCVTIILLLVPSMVSAELTLNTKPAIEILEPVAPEIFTMAIKAPSNLVAQSPTPGLVKLTWRDNSSNEPLL